MLNFVLCILNIFQFHYPYYQYRDNFIPRNINIHQVLPEIKHSFHVLSVWAKFHSTYYRYMLNFIPRIISIREISFPAFGDCTKKIQIFRMKLFSSQLLKGQYFIKWSEGELLDLKPDGNNFLYCSSMKNFFPCIQIVRYHCGGWSEEVNSCILIISYMVYL